MNLSLEKYGFKRIKVLKSMEFFFCCHYNILSLFLNKAIKIYPLYKSNDIFCLRKIKVKSCEFIDVCFHFQGPPGDFGPKGIRGPKGPQGAMVHVLII